MIEISMEKYILDVNHNGNVSHRQELYIVALHFVLLSLMLNCSCLVGFDEFCMLVNYFWCEGANVKQGGKILKEAS